MVSGEGGDSFLAGLPVRDTWGLHVYGLLTKEGVRARHVKREGRDGNGRC